MIYREPSITIMPVMCCQLSVPDGTDEAVTTQHSYIMSYVRNLSCLVLSFVKEIASMCVPILIHSILDLVGVSWRLNRSKLSST